MTKNFWAWGERELIEYLEKHGIDEDLSFHGLSELVELAENL